MMMSSTSLRVFIITSFIDYDFSFEDSINANDFVISIDGGADKARAHGVKTDLLIGDFDSICSSPVEHDCPIERYPSVKDYTDLEIALKKAVSLKADDVLIIGGIGGRLDHTVANIQLLSRYTDCFESLSMEDGLNRCFIAKADDEHPGYKTVIRKGVYKYISIFSLSDECTGVSFSGVKYPLEYTTLDRTFPLGVSNEILDKIAELSVEQGTMFVVLSSDAPK